MDNLHRTREPNEVNLSAMLGQHGNSFQLTKTLEEFYDRLEGLTDVILSMDHICGYCYTQLTDVEQEKNGIYYYDRTEKFDMKRISEVFSKSRNFED